MVSALTGYKVARKLRQSLFQLSYILAILDEWTMWLAASDRVPNFDLGIYEYCLTAAPIT